MTRAYKNFTPIMGLYRVTHLPSGRSLIGASEHVQGYLNRIRFQLDAGSHPNKAMQQDWKAGTPDDFTFEVLDELKPQEGQDIKAELADLLELWLDKLALTPEQKY